MAIWDKLPFRKASKGPRRVEDLRSPTFTALLVAGVYAALAVVWIVYGRRLQSWAAATFPEVAPWLPPLETWGLVLVTALALFVVLRLLLHRRNKTARALQDAHDHLWSHLRHNPLALVEWDRDFRVKTWSKAAEELFGWSAEDALGRSWLDWDLVAPNDRPSLEILLQNLRQEEPGGTLAVQRNVRRDGKEIWCEWNTSWIRDARGRFSSILCLVHDITRDREVMAEMQRMNRDLELKVARRTRDLAATNRDLRAFTHSISNDLRGPVRSMIGFTEILRDRYTEELPPEARKQLVYLLAAGRQLDHLIEDLMDYGRLGSQGITLEPVDLLDVAQSAVRSLEDAFPEAEAAISLPGTTETIPADRALFQDVLTNLLENALKYRHSRRPARVAVSTQRSSDEVQVRVRDNGPGIPQEHRDRVFRLFERLHSQESHPGTGMGLAMVRKAMNLMGGQVTAHDHDGPGVTFLLRFPVYSPLVGSPGEPVRRDGGGSAAREGRPADAPPEATSSPAATDGPGGGPAATPS